MYKQLKHFAALDALRFFAAMLVLFHHSEKVRLKYGMESLEGYSFFNLGGFAVSFFFVLSGFLITFLLLRERKKFGRVSIKKFYMRRVLRIWPLYFLLVGLGLWVIPWGLGVIGYPYELPYSAGEVWYLYIFFAPFMVNIMYGSSLLEPLWSIGVEELFYLIFAPIFRFFGRWLVPLLVVFIAIYCVVKLLMPNPVLSALQFEAMAVGALGAYWVWRRQSEVSKSLFFSYPVQSVVLLVLALRILCGGYLAEQLPLFNALFFTPVVSDLLFSLIFVHTIINTSLSRKSLFRLDHPALNYLGAISYGIYMYHMIAIFFVVMLLRDTLNSSGIIVSSIIFYGAVIAITLVASALSKRYFEDIFLRIKHRYSR